MVTGAEAIALDYDHRDQTIRAFPQNKGIKLEGYVNNKHLYLSSEVNLAISDGWYGNNFVNKSLKLTSVMAYDNERYTRGF